MKAVLVSEHGGSDKLEVTDVPAPGIAPDEALVRVAATSINHLDLWVVRGVPGHRFPLPMVPGSDFAGTVEAVGPAVTRFKPGDRVAVAPGYGDPNSDQVLTGFDHLAPDYSIFGETRNGGYAELCNVPGRNLIPLPDEMSFEDAAAFSLTFLTAHGMLVRNARIRPGEDVLIQAAGSGVSVAALKIARLWGAGRVFVTAGSDEKVEKALALGADVGINYREKDFRRVILKETGGRGVDIAVDHVGPDTIGESLRCLRKGGRLVTCGSTTGGTAEINLRLLFFKSLSLIGSTMGPRGDLVELWEHHRAGRLTPVVDRVFPIREIAAAHDYIAERKAFGKVVVDARKW